MFRSLDHLFSPPICAARLRHQIPTVIHSRQHLPIDHEETAADKIFQANIDLIRKAQVVAANLDPFRGPEPDSGTAFELGYALALGKKVCGYVTRLDSVADRVANTNYGPQASPDHGELLKDFQGMTVENFGLPCNLMLSIPTHIVEGGLEACLKSLRTRPGIRLGKD